MKILVVLLHCGIEELFADANAALAYTASCYEGISFGKAGQTTAQLPIENAKQPTKILEVTPKTDATVILAKGKGRGFIKEQRILTSCLIHTSENALLKRILPPARR